LKPLSWKPLSWKLPTTGLKLETTTKRVKLEASKSSADGVRLSVRQELQASRVEPDLSSFEHAVGVTSFEHAVGVTSVKRVVGSFQLNGSQLNGFKRSPPSIAFPHKMHTCPRRR
jgi:hypothetical protein